jgi:hypothetical protein
MSSRDSDASDSLSELDTNRPVPSRSYAPHSLTPFRPLDVPDAQDVPPTPPSAPNRTPLIVGGIVGLGLVAFVFGILYVVYGG